MAASVYTGPRINPAAIGIAKANAMRLYARLPQEVQAEEAHAFGVLLAMLLTVNDELRPPHPPAQND